MPRLLAAVLVFVVALPIFAAGSHADLSILFSVAPRVSVGDPVFAFGYLRNHGPDAAENVVVTPSGGEFIFIRGCIPDDAGRCVIEYLPSGDEIGVSLRLDPQTTGKTLSLTVDVTSATPDPNPANNRVVATVDVVLATSMRFYLFSDNADPGETVEVESRITNNSSIPATNASFTLPLPEGWTFERSLSEELQCSSAGGSATCTVARIEPHSEVRSRFLVRAPNTPEGNRSVYLPVKLTTANGLLNEESDTTGYFNTTIYRHLTVNSTADEGAGSLREAITNANSVCATPNGAPCKIVFDIAGSGPVQTIRPRTPLPAITAGLQIEGSTQTRRRGDTNPAGPEIEINGSLLASGDGLQVTGNIWIGLRDLVINGFPGNGVVIVGSGYGRNIERCYIGTDARGQIAVPNGGRGVVIDSVEPYRQANAILRDNVISGNARSGVFIPNGFEITIIGNRIGASAGEHPMPLGNGATGIYLGPGTSAIAIQKNVIAFNTEWGIGTANAAGYIHIRGNAITGNGLVGIDYGLDLATPDVQRITAARYDAGTNTTRIEGRVNASFVPRIAIIEVFANTTDTRQGELFLGQVSLQSETFTFDYPGDLRGRFLTTTFTTPNNYYPEAPYLTTSEFSAPFHVEGQGAGPIDPAAIVPRGADIAIRLGSFYQVHAGMTTGIHTVIENLGPGTPKNVVVDITTDHGRLYPLDSRCVATDTGLRCSDGTSSVTFDIEVPQGIDKVTIRARATSDTFDPDPSNNQSVLELRVTSSPYLDLRIEWPGPADPGATATYSAYVTHHTAVDARDVEVHIRIPFGWSLASGPANGWTCGMEGQEVVCRTPFLKGLSTASFTYVLRAPGENVRFGRESSSAYVTAAGSEFQLSSHTPYEVFRVRRVTTTADAGPGSLRDAILHANDECRSMNHSCKIVFAIDAARASGGVFTIRPLLPLPAVTAHNVTIDARTQTAHTGDTNPLGPEVELNGSLAALGNGLEIHSMSESVVRGFAINGFPDNGILVQTATGSFGSRFLVDNYIGTDPTGRVAVPNRGRGITVETEGDQWTNLHLIGNLISGNDRAGVFIACGRVIRVAGNRITLNGASGVYLGPVEGVAVEGNEISANAHAGIATDRRAAWNSLRGNSTFDNGSLGIDHALDLVTFNDDANRAEDLPRFPVITSAVWDSSANVTRIEGRVRGTRFGRELTVEVFANASPDGTGYGEGQRSLGEIRLPPSQSEQPFTFTIAEDLRGQFITATLSQAGSDNVRASWTSEISQAVPVQ